MGACASIAKSMKGEAGEAPAPEPAKEESVKPVETTEEVKVEQEEAKADGETEVKSDDEKQSLGSLLNETEEKKESAEGEKPITEAPKTEGEAEAKKSEETTTEKVEAK